MTGLSYLEHRPRAEFLPHVECIWEVWDTRVRSGRSPERVVPDGCPELIVHLGDRFSRLVGERWMAQPRAFLAGPLTHPWTLRGGRRIRTLGIRFRPGATTRFLRVVMGRASDREVPLGRLVGAAEERALLTSLRRARGRVGRATAAERWLLLRMRELAPRADDARRAVDVILRSHGRATMERVARSIGWSTRRIERAFERDVGLRPKLFARIVRLNAVLATLDDAERRRVVDLALDAGYFDQAHLLRDFRALAGRPPRAGRETDGEMARNFTRPGRLRALLSGD